MVFIERKFIPDPQSDQHSYCHTHGQSCDIDKGMRFVFSQISKSRY
jgi:hypothetical protein